MMKSRNKVGIIKHRSGSNCMYLSTKTLPNDDSINTVMKIKQERFFCSVM